MNSSAPTSPFEWIPGGGYDEPALARLVRAFPRPDEPMGEAWFMSPGRRVFDDLTGDMSSIAPDDLTNPLREITSGTSCFGPHAEWSA